MSKSLKKSGLIENEKHKKVKKIPLLCSRFNNCSCFGDFYCFTYIKF